VEDTFFYNTYALLHLPSPTTNDLQIQNVFFRQVSKNNLQAAHLNMSFHLYLCP
jgi:hypothetical protein